MSHPTTTLRDKVAAITSEKQRAAIIELLHNFAEAAAVNRDDPARHGNPGQLSKDYWNGRVNAYQHVANVLLSIAPM